MYRDKRKQMQLRKEELESFEACNSEHADQSRSPVEQAELLPYQHSYDIDENRLVFGRQIGVGAYGRVYQAQLTGCSDGSKTVTVKTIKSKSNTEQLRRFRSEIKILMYIGRHQNIINLIGVSSKHMTDKGEMLMVVEYCSQKSIFDHMQRNRDRLISQIGESHILNCDEWNNVICKLGEISITSAAGSSAVQWGKETFDQNTDTLGQLPCENNPITTQLTNSHTENVPDGFVLLLDWTYQVANGMDFLSQKKIIHGNLAAKNLLLADNNIVKIADFSLEKDVYNRTDNVYNPSKIDMLAIRWTALESLKFSEFSSESDVWSFGVVMWEIFTLGGHPYQDIGLPNLCKDLEAGVRLPMPSYSNDHLYSIMKSCWQEKPSARPTFANLKHVFSQLYSKAKSL